jgi:hypothetical protein
MSIARRRFEEHLKEKEEALQRELAFKFKARSIPDSSLGLKLDKILEEQQRKREQTIQNRKIELQSTIKSFTLSSKPKPVEPQIEKTKDDDFDPELLQKFKARPIPQGVLDAPKRSHELEQARKERIRQRAQTLLQESQLPSCMSSNKESNKPKKCRCPDPDAECTFRPQICATVPDFKKLQDDFQQELRKRREKLAKEKGIEFKWKEDPTPSRRPKSTPPRNHSQPKNKHRRSLSAGTSLRVSTVRSTVASTLKLASSKKRLQEMSSRDLLALEQQQLRKQREKVSRIIMISDILS